MTAARYRLNRAVVPAAALTVVVAGGVLIAVQARRAAATRDAHSANGSTASLWVEVDGRRMHARVAGDPANPPVVCVHGLGVSSRYFGPTQERLARDFRVYAPDLPGSGLSEAPARPLDVPGLARALAGWMDAAGLSRAAFVGNSLGSQVVVELAATRPELVERVVLSAPTIDPQSRNTLAQAARLLHAALRDPSPQLFVATHDYLESGLARAFATYRLALRDRVESKLPLVTAPALVVRGGLDPVVSQAWAERVATLLPRGRLLTLPDAPHAAQYATPDKFVAAIRPFLLDDR